MRNMLTLLLLGSLVAAEDLQLWSTSGGPSPDHAWTSMEMAEAAALIRTWEIVDLPREGSAIFTALVRKENIADLSNGSVSIADRVDLSNQTLAQIAGLVNLYGESSQSDATLMGESLRMQAMAMRLAAIQTHLLHDLLEQNPGIISDKVMDRRRVGSISVIDDTLRVIGSEAPTAPRQLEEYAIVLLESIPAFMLDQPHSVLEAHVRQVAAYHQAEVRPEMKAAFAKLLTQAEGLAGAR